MGDNSRPVVHVICGPTAAGKTRAALELARVADVAVVSADSRQLYRGFDVGTAKPSPAEQRAVAHYGIDVLDPAERASAAWWAERADGWIRAVIARGQTPLVVGGTGLYLRALFGHLFEEPAMDAAQRVALQEELGELPVEELRRWVARLDPDRAHLGRTQLLRAIEIALLTGRRVSDLHRERRTPPRWRARYLLVDAGPALGRHIAERARTMFDAGWADEVRELSRQVSSDAPAWNASGYRTVRAMVDGELTPDLALERVVIETRQYAKRQRTWFRHQLAGEDVTSIDSAGPAFSAQLAAWWRGAARHGRGGSAA
ncbi:MAG TPA: tRNA (adenosine(37)-N6)-dimethylallyltransferase MiaA [Gemmatimonadaceae bacterium]